MCSSPITAEEELCVLGFGERRSWFVCSGFLPVWVRSAARSLQRWIVRLMKLGRRRCLWESRGRDSLLLWLLHRLSLFPHLHLQEKESEPDHPSAPDRRSRSLRIGEQIKGIVNETVLLIYSASGHPRCRWVFSQTVKKIFSWNCGAYISETQNESSWLLPSRHKTGIQHHKRLIFG